MHRVTAVICCLVVSVGVASHASTQEGEAPSDGVDVGELEAPPESSATGADYVSETRAERPRTTASERSVVAVETVHDDGFGENRRSQRISALGQRSFGGNGRDQVELLAAASAGRFGLPGALRLEDYSRGAIGAHDAYLDDTRGNSYRGLVGSCPARPGRPG